LAIFEKALVKDHPDVRETSFEKIFFDKLLPGRMTCIHTGLEGNYEQGTNAGKGVHDHQHDRHISIRIRGTVILCFLKRSIIVVGRGPSRPGPLFRNIPHGPGAGFV
jgi:hypothetical protein